jgi:hypothetical protein
LSLDPVATALGTAVVSRSFDVGTVGFAQLFQRKSMCWHVLNPRGKMPLAQHRHS